jgi:Tol biopolymer transport system component
VIVCGKCGHENDEQEAYCAKCGVNLRWAGDPIPAKPEAAPSDKRSDATGPPGTSGTSGSARDGGATVPSGDAPAEVSPVAPAADTATTTKAVPIQAREDDSARAPEPVSGAAAAGGTEASASWVVEGGPSKPRAAEGPAVSDQGEATRAASESAPRAGVLSAGAGAAATTAGVGAGGSVPGGDVGTTAVTPGPNEVICPVCSTPNDLSRTFCKRCGNRLRSIAAPPQSPPPPPPRFPLTGSALIGGAGVLLVAVIAAGAWWFFGRGGSPTPSPAPSAVASATAVTPTASGPTASASPSASPSGTPFGATGLIVYASDRTGNNEIFVIDLGTRTVTQITDRPGRDWDPELSPDRSRIAWAAETGIRIADMPGGEGAFEFTHNGTKDISPSWSPDGKTIAFASSRDGDLEIYLRTAVEGATDLAKLTSNSVPDYEPVWSPTRKEIAFTRGEGDDKHIRIVDLVTKQGRAVPSHDAVDEDPAWSPDGDQIAFASGPAHDRTDIYVMDRDGKILTQLTTDGASNHDPAWSPDGKFIVYATGGDLVIVDVATGATQVLEYPGSDNWPSWR